MNFWQKKGFLFTHEKINSVEKTHPPTFMTTFLSIHVLIHNVVKTIPVLATQNGECDGFCFFFYGKLNNNIVFVVFSQSTSGFASLCSPSQRQRAGKNNAFTISYTISHNVFIDINKFTSSLNDTIYCCTV